MWDYNYTLYIELYIMVQIADDDDRNLLEDMFFPGAATYDSDEGGALN